MLLSYSSLSLLSDMYAWLVYDDLIGDTSGGLSKLSEEDMATSELFFETGVV